MEGPKAPSKARSAEWVRSGEGRHSPSPVRESGEGRHSPSPVWESGGIAPRRIFKFNLQIYAFSCYFCIKQYAEYRVGNRYSLLSIFLARIWQQNLAHVPLQEFAIHVKLDHSHIFLHNIQLRIGQTVLSDHHYMYIVAGGNYIHAVMIRYDRLNFCRPVMFMLANNIIAEISCKCKLIVYQQQRIKWQLRDN